MTLRTHSRQDFVNKTKILQRKNNIKTYIPNNVVLYVKMMKLVFREKIFENIGTVNVCNFLKKLFNQLKLA